MNNPIINLTIPERLYSNDELKGIIASQLKKEKESKKGKTVYKEKIISPERLFGSKLFNRTY